MASLATSLETLDMARALLLLRMRVPSVSLLDFKLGARMLVRYPGLTLIGVPAIAFAVVASVWTFEYVERFAGPMLSFDEGDRIVGLVHWNVEDARSRLPQLHDFVDWSEELHSVAEMGAFRSTPSNLATDEDVPIPVLVAEITSAALQITRTPPLLGRTFDVSDEQLDAPKVLIVGYDVWQNRFEGDPDIIGRTVRLGSSVHTILGVMPDGFAYPIAHEYWTPLRLNVVTYPRGQAPSVFVVGRLAEGVRMEEARAELSTVGDRTAFAYPETHGALRTRLVRYTRSIYRITPQQRAQLRLSNLPLVLLMVLVCGNVALLMFARAASRENEIVIRSALGASRGRIVTQLVAEALVLGAVGTAVGIAVASKSMIWALTQVQDELLDGFQFPFWFSQGVGLSTLVYIGGSALLGSVLMGVLPALKMTGRRVESTLKQSAAGGSLAFGGVWTAIIVMQVAVTVTLPVMTYLISLELSRIEDAELPFPAEEYVVAGLGLDDGVQAASMGMGSETPEEFRVRFARTYQGLVDRLAAESNVVGVTFADRLPLQPHPFRRIELDHGAAEPVITGVGHRVSSANVATDFLETFGVSVLAGRTFGSGDTQAEESPVLVNQSFVDGVMGGRNPIGRRIRYTLFQESDPAGSDDVEPEPWHEIVGVVPDMGMALAPNPRSAGIYHPAAPGSYPVQIAVHVVGDPGTFTQRLREISATVDPLLRLNDVMPLEQGISADLKLWTFFFRTSIFGGGFALMLSLAGIFSAMSFAVSRKTREIGIRSALGSNRRRIVIKIFKRPAIQVGLGLLGGAVLSEALASVVVDGGLVPKVATTVLICSIVTACVCMLACVVPTRRALAVEPAEALRGE